jgi:hypothetical protein
VQHDSVDPNSTLRPGLPVNSLRDGFEPAPGDEVSLNNVNSAFIGTDLNERLRELGARTLIALGISSDICVSTAIRTGANMGGNVGPGIGRVRLFRFADACGTSLPPKPSMPLTWLRSDWSSVRSSRRAILWQDRSDWKSVRRLLEIDGSKSRRLGRPYPPFRGRNPGGRLF